MLITFKNHHFWDMDSESPEVSPDIYAYEMVALDRIVHIYQVMPDQNVICIEYLGCDGNYRTIHECYANKFHSASRIFELQRIMKGETKS